MEGYQVIKSTAFPNGAAKLERLNPSRSTTLTIYEDQSIHNVKVIDDGIRELYLMLQDYFEGENNG